jgi:hypothetical protein
VPASLAILTLPYRGGGPAMQDIIGGRVDYICTLTGSVVPLVEGKTVKAIARLAGDRGATPYQDRAGLCGTGISKRSVRMPGRGIKRTNQSSPPLGA